ncbi:molybdopterin-binding protein [Olivibacter sp. 47]|uniref:Molybdopterin-binding protein n=1 Tax=Sphingobacterium sp. (strain 21) TaxID=743722 RepID=F4CF37_SPHS2|nr:hypothetical protein [Olivibacter sp. 47]MDM8174118.1 molybdopterin-binding protein [Olivibacter sp. 47]
MKAILTTFLILSAVFLRAQDMKNLDIITPDNKKTTLTFEETATFEVHSLDSLRIYNHAGVYRSTLKAVKGILLKDILKDITFGEESPKVLSEYYIVCIATDGYKVVLSWNELFNTPIGDSVLVVTNIKAATNGEQENELALLSPKDKATGRRYVKQLQTIKILRVKI